MIIHVLANGLPSKCKLQKIHKAVIRFQNQLLNLSISEKNYLLFKTYTDSILKEIGSSKVNRSKNGFICHLKYKKIKVQIEDGTIKILQTTKEKTTSLWLQALSNEDYRIEEYTIYKHPKNNKLGMACITVGKGNQTQFFELLKLNQPTSKWVITTTTMKPLLPTNIETSSFPRMPYVLKK